MEELTDDVVSEIIAKLPLKEAVQCSSLNKTYYKYVAGADFARKHAVLSLSPIIFHHSACNPKIYSVVDFPTAGKIPKRINLAAEGSILDSCNGVFFMSVLKRCYIFNPITGGIKSVGYRIRKHYDVGEHDVGLAVDFPARPPSFVGYNFKLVTIDIKKSSIHQTLVKFGELVVPSAANNNRAAVRSTAELACRSFTLMADRNIRPVYARGCLHWLGEDAKKIAAYDVAKERAKFVPGPIKNTGDHGFDNNTVDKWFGFAGGSLHFIYALSREIVVHSHVRGAWRVAHKIPNISTPRNNGMRNGVVAFFDGRRVLLHLRKMAGDGEMHAYDLSTGKWRKIGAGVEGWADWHQVFVSYTPTLARVSDVYLPATGRFTRRMLVFAGVQALLKGDHVALKNIESLGSQFSWY